MSLNFLADSDHGQEDLLKSFQYCLGSWAGGASLWIAGITPLKFLPFLSQLTANGEFKQATSIAFQTTKTSLYHIFIAVCKNCLLKVELFAG